MFAIIDIETCGGTFQYKKGRITEVCVLVHDGLSVVEKFTTLINPECYISPMYTNITGITNEMVQDAPKFHEIASEIIRLTEGRIFVAHNVNFDYGFIKDEFASLGYKYKRDTLCTVRLSRKLIPGKASYSLGNLCTSLGIDNLARHRAEGDAVATAQLFDILMQAKSNFPQYKNLGVHEIMSTRLDKIKKYILDKLPEECGVYYFLNREGQIVYVGKSINMYARALSHFNNDNKKARKMLAELHNVDFVTTGSELIALLHEAAEIKHHKPIFNRLSKDEQFNFSVNWFTDDNGIINFNVVPYEEAENAVLSYTSYGSALNRLDKMTISHELCLHYAGSIKNDSACFNHQLKLCKGICCGVEYIEDYNQRAKKAIEEFSFSRPDFVIKGEGRNKEEKSVVLVENGKFYGYGYIDNSTYINSHEDFKDYVKRAPYYPDADLIIRSWLKKQEKR